MVATAERLIPQDSNVVLVTKFLIAKYMSCGMFVCRSCCFCCSGAFAKTKTYESFKAPETSHTVGNYRVRQPSPPFLHFRHHHHARD